MFKIKDLKKPTFDSEIHKKIAHQGLELTLTIRHDADFLNALSKVQAQIDKEKTLSKDSLKRGQLSSSEGLLYIIGEYAISEWNVSDNDDKPIVINGENLLLVLENVPNLSDFLALLINEFNTAMGEFSTAVENLKKKSSNTTSGKR